MKLYTIIGGLNGVGKSGFTGVLKEHTTSQFLFMIQKTPSET